MNMPILPRSDDGSINYAELVNRLGQTWPSRMARAAWGGLTLPGDVYRGNVSMWGEDGRTNQEVINRAADLAGVMMTGPLGTPRGALGSGPVRRVAGNKNFLPTDAESRFARADAMGFRRDMDLYHGTTRDFSEFKSVPTNADGMVTPGVSLARSPEIANEFALLGEQANPQVYRLWHRTENPAMISLDGGESHGQVVATLRDAFDGGRDAVMLKNYTSPNGTRGDIIIVRDANQLRSPNAMFDPSKKNSDNLLASLSGAAIAPSAYGYLDQLNSVNSGQ